MLCGCLELFQKQLLPARYVLLVPLVLFFLFSSNFVDWRYCQIMALTVWRSDSSAKEFANLVAQTRRVLDIIVNNAGTINKNKKTWGVPVEEFDMVIDTNL
ncbi:NADPH-dependent pterin aldehyde reductase-like [Dioscorea cayenensis subsp. rotundata]|uniref:NADPH-dependent pterin aldehyde reductase-like n=1 Tax=Dioscorea cayennensis subsp. rotundata TaxID=55577 RepID=A0AB40C1D1_DIOCR|nr:NADPH-dependent pterin aldehyde reductase-like [Dioscorea cayenensis subsp. rotundata]XP_039132988.1 NADPH-dependent pterin aldehyde reductase-like [Dioscorea cayenensis subsp. rotundata]